MRKWRRPTGYFIPSRVLVGLGAVCFTLSQSFQD
ncbi:DUF2776 family protein [Shigella flexneri]